MGDLSANFSKYKFQCPCCGKVKINPRLITKLEEVRKAIGDIPIKITSGYRCKKYNQSINGYVDSPHLYGLAADTKCKGLTIIEYAFKANYRVEGIRLGIYPNHLHIDVEKPVPSRYWFVRTYNSTPIYSKNEYDLKKFLIEVKANVVNSTCL